MVRKEHWRLGSPLLLRGCHNIPIHRFSQTLFRKLFCPIKDARKSAGVPQILVASSYAAHAALASLRTGDTAIWLEDLPIILDLLFALAAIATVIQTVFVVLEFVRSGSQKK